MSNSDLITRIQMNVFYNGQDAGIFSDIIDALKENDQKIAKLETLLRPLAYADIIPFTIAEQFRLHAILVKPEDIDDAKEMLENKK